MRAAPLSECRVTVRSSGAATLWVVLGALAFPLAAQAGDTPALSDYTERELLVNVFQAHCISCHGKIFQKGGLDLRTRESILRGGDSGPGIVPGKPEESIVLLRLVRDEMPPTFSLLGDDGYVRRVNAVDIDKLRAWIEAGAPSDPVEKPATGQELHGDSSDDEADQPFWAFRPPRRGDPPAVRDVNRVRTAIDAFLLARLEKHGLSFSPEADRRTLLRRAHFSITGLGPTVAEQDRFLNDSAPDAYERLVDRLLDSSAYGERWATRWLDAAGYADSHGKISPDRKRPYAWRYRDWVIRALNRDMSYDEFLVDQIAGDELFDHSDPDQFTSDNVARLIATGFLRMGPDDTDEGAQNHVEYRSEVLADQIEIFSSAVLGLTLDCARCHDHKYDPLPTRDYYRFSAIFQAALDPYDWRVPSEYLYAGGRTLELTPEHRRDMPFGDPEENRVVARLNADLDRQIKEQKQFLASKTAEYRNQFVEKKIATFDEDTQQLIRQALEVPLGERSDEQLTALEMIQEELSLHRQSLRERSQKYCVETDPVYNAMVNNLKARKPLPAIQCLRDTGGDPTPTYVLKRGDYRSPGARVAPGVPAMLREGLEPYVVSPPNWSSRTSGRRLALARWLVQPGHPLTARVLVNRLWHDHFGRGIVATPGNFGRTGMAPSHPELLDWLATEFVRSGWSMKTVHRLILNSSVYRQSSRFDRARHGVADPGNVYLSRFPFRRLDAEVIRDSVLAVSGRLDRTPFGPPSGINVSPEREVTTQFNAAGARRSIYMLRKRTTPLTLLSLFDQPLMQPNCVERARSTVVTQAFQLYNSAMLRDCGDHFAAAVIGAVGDDSRAQLTRVYRLAFARPPTAEELELGVGELAELEKHWRASKPANEAPPPVRKLALATFCHAIFNSSEFLYVD